MGVCESNRDIDKRHKSRIEHNLKCNFMLAQMSKEVIREVFACLLHMEFFLIFFTCWFLKEIYAERARSSLTPQAL